MALKPLNSVAGFSVGETPANIILANGDITTNNISTTGVANLNSISNVKISGGSSGQVIQTDGSGNLSFVTIDTWKIQNGNSNVQVLANSNVTISVSGNANIATFTGTGLDVSGYINAGNISANGNLSANNYIVTPGATDLIVAPASQLTRIYANLNPFSDVTYNLGNGLARWNEIHANNATLSSNLSVTGNAAVGGLLTNNLYYANGQPWDLQEAAGNTTEIQYNSGDNFAASANFTYNDTTQLFTVIGNAQFNNANLGNLATANYVNVANQINGNIANFSGNLTALNANLGNLATANYVNVANQINGNIANFSGNLTALNANLGNLATANYINVANEVNGNVANFSGNLTALNANLGNLATANYVNVANEVNGNVANFSGNLTALNANLGNLATANYVNVANEVNGNVANFSGNLTALNANLGNLATANFVNISSNLNVTGTAAVGNLRTDNLLHANGSPWDFQQPAGSNTQIQYNDGAGGFGASANFAFDYLNNELELNGNILLGAASQNQIVNLTGNAIEIRGGWNNATSASAALFAGDYANGSNFGKFAVIGNVLGNSVTVTEANISYWRTIGGSANALVVDTIAVNSTSSSTGAVQVGGGLGVSGNAYVGGLLNVTGNIANANNISATNTLFANNANITSNISAGNANLGNLAIANFVQTSEILNGNSNVRVQSNGNISISVTGTSNVVVIGNTGANIVGYIEANGNGSFGAVYSPTVTSNAGALTLTAAAGNNNVIIVPTGTGNVDVSTRHITSLADPTNPQDAATKAYVDSVATGLQIHPAVRVTSVTNLTATYANGGTSLTTTTISGGNTITFSGNHGLSLNDEIYWTNAFNGLTAQNAYFVETIPSSTQITVRATYTGAEVTTLTNGTGLSQPALANPGVGATLTNAGANAALQIDGITLSATNRVLVQGQTNAYENGAYVVTTVGDGSTAWVLTRATDADQYAPSDVSKLGYGDYFFVSQGGSYAGSSYVVTAPIGEIVFGISSIGFTQFSAAGSYTAGNGIDITGTTISANVDNITTAIVSGNIVVKANAQLTTPNVGAATGTSLDLTGNLLAGNVNSNALITAANIDVTSNVLANNFSANSNITSNNATVNLALTGNTANFSGNVIVNNITVNNFVNGNIGNFSGNVNAAFLKAGTGTPIANLTNPLISGVTTANNFIQAYVHNESNGTAASADFIAYPNNGNDISGWIDMGITSDTFNQAIYSVTEENEGYIFMSAPALSGTSGNLIFATDSTGANNSIEFFVNGFNQLKSNRKLLIATTGVTVNGDFTSGNTTVGNLSTAGSITAANVTANTNVIVGNTKITSSTVTTTSVTANQTIASLSTTGVTGIEFLVKAVDSTGSKYSVATVQAVTDGTSVDYSTFGTVQLGGYTGSLAVNIDGGNVKLQVTPASSNSTVWTTQIRTI